MGTSNLDIAKNISIVYILFGLQQLYFNHKFYEWYVMLLLFMVFKIVFAYRKCTVSYIECLSRNVKKEEGYLYNFLEGFILLRNDSFYFTMVLLYTLIVIKIYLSKT